MEVLIKNERSERKFKARKYLNVEVRMTQDKSRNEPSTNKKTSDAKSESIPKKMAKQSCISFVAMATIILVALIAISTTSIECHMKRTQYHEQVSLDRLSPLLS